MTRTAPGACASSHHHCCCCCSCCWRDCLSVYGGRRGTDDVSLRFCFCFCFYFCSFSFASSVAVVVVMWWYQKAGTPHRSTHTALPCATTQRKAVPNLIITLHCTPEQPMLDVLTEIGSTGSDTPRLT
eukprot:RCo030632